MTRSLVARLRRLEKRMPAANPHAGVCGWVRGVLQEPDGADPLADLANALAADGGDVGEHVEAVLQRAGMGDYIEAIRELFEGRLGAPPGKVTSE
jgi:hypothetical protein